MNWGVNPDFSPFCTSASAWFSWPASILPHQPFFSSSLRWAGGARETLALAVGLPSLAGEPGDAVGCAVGVPGPMGDPDDSVNGSQFLSSELSADAWAGTGAEAGAWVERLPEPPLLSRGTSLLTSPELPMNWGVNPDFSPFCTSASAWFSWPASILPHQPFFSSSVRWAGGAKRLGLPTACVLLVRTADRMGLPTVGESDEPEAGIGTAEEALSPLGAGAEPASRELRCMLNMLLPMPDCPVRPN
mmetsp:Transcript_19458/g.42146  ORF Transcript_19458/g.42146 Transcript_19458/m.42146 type:complete len:246 (-) Transcript_19458:440-1177(-)